MPDNKRMNGGVLNHAGLKWRAVSSHPVILTVIPLMARHMKYFLPTLMLLVFCGCDGRRVVEHETRRQSVDTPGEITELPPEVNAAILEHLQPAIGRAVVQAVGQLIEQLSESFKLDDETGQQLLSAVMENIETESGSLLIVCVHHAQYTGSSTTEVAVDGSPFWRVTRLAASTERPYVTVSQIKSGIVIKEFRLDSETDGNWIVCPIETLRINLDADNAG